MAEMQPLKSIIILLMFLLSACGDPIKEQITQQIPLTEQRIELLAQALDNGQVRNANLISQYADRLLKDKPDYKPLIDEFLKDAGTQGPMYLALVDRLNTVKKQPQMFKDSQALYDELLNLYQAADPVLYSDALSDPLNVLADMSEGTLPRVNALSKAQSLAANKAQDFGTGEQLIGNPAYGNWTTGSNGMSFWAWYGMYSMMGDLFGSRRTSYNDWGRSRNYSYLKAVAKNILVLTVKIELALQVSLAKVKAHKPVPIDLLAKQVIKALMQNQVKVPKMLVSETVKVQPHVALDVESRDKYEYIY